MSELQERRWELVAKRDEIRAQHVQPLLPSILAGLVGQVIKSVEIGEDYLTVYLESGTELFCAGESGNTTVYIEQGDTTIYPDGGDNVFLHGPDFQAKVDAINKELEEIRRKQLQYRSAWR